MMQRKKSSLISIHPPLAGWDATAQLHEWPKRQNFNPPTPCGVGPWPFLSHCWAVYISIHPPLAGWDSKSTADSFIILRFQSTHPLRGGTLSNFYGLHNFLISIHPPLAGWDLTSGQIIPSMETDFNPPTPCGVGQVKSPLWWIGTIISIHPPLAGWDDMILTDLPYGMTFQSTHPLRGGTSRPTVARRCADEFQSTHPLRGGTGRLTSCKLSGRISIHPPLAGWDSKNTQENSCCFMQNP